MVYMYTIESVKKKKKDDKIGKKNYALRIPPIRRDDKMGLLKELKGIQFWTNTIPCPFPIFPSTDF